MSSRSFYCWLGTWWVLFWASSSAVQAAATAAGVPLFPKYVTEPVVGSRRLADKHHSEKRSSIQNAKSFLVPGSCHVGKPFEFPLSSGNGNGMLCAKAKDDDSINDDDTRPIPQIYLETRSMEEGYIINYAGNKGVPNCFGLTENEASIGLPFVFQNVPASGTTVQVTCDEPQTFVIVVLDDAGSDEGINVESNPEKGTLKYGREFVHPRLYNPLAKITKIQVDAYGSALNKKGGNKPTGGTEKIHNIHVDETVGGLNDLALEQDDDVGEIALIQYEVEDEGGNRVHRTYVAAPSKPPLEPNQDIELESMALTDEGDLMVVLSGLPDMAALGGEADDDDDNDMDARLLCTIRLGLVILTDAGQEKDESLVDVSAMINRDMPFLMVHGGWVRKRLHELGMSNDEQGWDLVLEDAHCEDPGQEYQITSTLHENSRGRRLRTLLDDDDDDESTRHGRMLLCRTPSDEELEVSEEMLVGRPPKIHEEEHGNEGGGRSLQQVTEHRFILIHGWCSDGNGWPVANFVGSGKYKVVQYQDYNKNYSHDQFAKSILKKTCPYSGDQRVSGNIVAHSQGGAAALHMQNYCWSCLDRNPHTGKLIQTVGTPFQGTALTSQVAMLGAILGVGYGSNSDMSESGAVTWMDRLASWSKAKVTYYRSKYEDVWWRADFCNVLVHAVIGWPDDGAVEVTRGVLPGGVNGGIATKQCHSRSMRDPPQCLDRNRNLLMTSVAAAPR